MLGAVSGDQSLGGLHRVFCVASQCVRLNYFPRSSRATRHACKFCEACYIGLRHEKPSLHILRIVKERSITQRRASPLRQLPAHHRAESRSQNAHSPRWKQARPRQGDIRTGITSPEKSTGGPLEKVGELCAPPLDPAPGLERHFARCLQALHRIADWMELHRHVPVVA